MKAETADDVETLAHRPPARPVVKKMRWPFPIIWLVPILAAFGTAYYLQELFTQRGPEIVIRFDDANGIRPAETHLHVHGVNVGTVTGVRLSDDKSQALVHVQLRTDVESIARIGTQFWLVRPDLSGGEFRGLNTFVSGPYIEALPGNGPPSNDFAGQSSAPIMITPGVRVIVHADRIEKLQVDSPIYYRGVQVGAVQDVRLSSDAAQVTATLFIWDRYTPLLHQDSKFWMVKGADLQGGILGGISLKLDSLRTLLVGGVSFATPDSATDKPAGEGSTFELHEDAEKDWLTWMPKISLAPEKPTLQEDGHSVPQTPKKMLDTK